MIAQKTPKRVGSVLVLALVFLGLPQPTQAGEAPHTVPDCPVTSVSCGWLPGTTYPPYKVQGLDVTVYLLEEAGETWAIWVKIVVPSDPVHFVAPLEAICGSCDAVAGSRWEHYFEDEQVAGHALLENGIISVDIWLR